MSGLTSSNIGASCLKQEDKNAASGIEELSEISSAIRKEDSATKEDDPNSLENRLKSIRL